MGEPMELSREEQKKKARDALSRRILIESWGRLDESIEAEAKERREIEEFLHLTGRQIYEQAVATAIAAINKPRTDEFGSEPVL